jgi:hypothetical protein
MPSRASFPVKKSNLDLSSAALCRLFLTSVTVVSGRKFN